MERTRNDASNLDRLIYINVKDAEEYQLKKLGTSKEG